jgi:hypothetical protein
MGTLEPAYRDGNTLVYRELTTPPTARGWGTIDFRPTYSSPTYSDCTSNWPYYGITSSTLYGNGTTDHVELAKRYWAWVHSWDGSGRVLKSQRANVRLRSRFFAGPRIQPGLRLIRRRPIPTARSQRQAIRRLLR